MRILTGFQPSGKLHIGNYFGAVKPAVELQEEGDAFYFVANYHAMTSVGKAAELKDLTRECALDALACGINPEKSTFFIQNAIPEVHELAWILSTICPMGLLERCHSYKDKVAKGIAANHGLFAYPALMAADILLYDANLVPVGKDQKQHLEVTRDLAQKINDKFEDNLLVLPEPKIQESAAVVPGIDGQKMSKSYGNTIPLFGPEKKQRKLFMKILTDSAGVEDPKSTENSIILDLYRLLSSESEVEAMMAEFKAGGVGYGHFKQQLWEAYWDTFAPFREKREALESSSDDLEAILKIGENKAREVAAKTLSRVRTAVGLNWI